MMNYFFYMTIFSYVDNIQILIIILYHMMQILIITSNIYKYGYIMGKITK